jgi:hypothetical protein
MPRSAGRLAEVAVLFALSPLPFGWAGCSTLPPSERAPTQRVVDKGDAPEISRSSGEKGGVIIFWPRIIPKSDDAETRDLAGKLQERLKAIVAKELPGRPVDVRPEPERVCPRVGCAAMSVGVLFSKEGKSCAALALVSGPGASPSRIVPWAGEVQLSKNEVPFREAPERVVKVKDFVRCTELLGTINDADVVTAIKAAGSASP